MFPGNSEYVRVYELCLCLSISILYLNLLALRGLIFASYSPLLDGLSPRSLPSHPCPYVHSLSSSLSLVGCIVTTPHPCPVTLPTSLFHNPHVSASPTILPSVLILLWLWSLRTHRLGAASLGSTQRTRTLALEAVSPTSYR